ncbi:hypothetical protein CBR_g6287 [Chara braunii]|uniref:Peptidase A2 domain-containing protein n=1 Tax=Chara braunii TaxID=69332 RepID=A0A388KJF4_CHABU|nr:hypothetical protein CBR_g6287 [Chara braunii]|eukprot:GBG70156.1 hypothetical protein CBR_g6287 [Chara braunii]
MKRTMPCTYRLASKEEMEILESRETARQTIFSRLDVSKGKTKKEKDVRRVLSSRSGLKAFGGQLMRQGLDMERVWPGVPKMFLLGGHDGRRDVAPLEASLSALRTEKPSLSHLHTASAGTRSVLNRPILRRGTSPTVPQAQKIKKGNQPRVAPVVSAAKAQQEAPVVIVEEDLDTEDEKLKAEDERQARLHAQKRGLDENQDKKKDEGEEEEHQKKKNWYTISIEEGIDIEKMVDRILESHQDLVTLKEFLAASPKIREELKQRLTRRKVMTVKLGELIPPEANWTPAGAKMDWRCVATRHVMVKIGVSQHLALVDTGAEMNILREKEALELGVEIDRTDNGFLVGAEGSTPFCGTASNVNIHIGKVKGGKEEVKLQFEMASSSRQDKVQKMVRTAIARLSERLATQEKEVPLFMGDNVEEFIDLFTKLTNKERWTEDQIRDQVAWYSNEYWRPVVAIFAEASGNWVEFVAVIRDTFNFGKRRKLVRPGLHRLSCRGLDKRVSRLAGEMGARVTDNTGAASSAASSSSRRRVATVATIMLFVSKMEARASAVAVGGFRQGWARVGRIVFHLVDIFPTEVELREDQGTLEDPPRIYTFVTTAMKLVLSVCVCPLRKTHWFDAGIVYDVVNKSIHRKFEDEIMWLSLRIIWNHHARQGPFIYIEHYDRVGPYGVGFRVAERCDDEALQRQEENLLKLFHI